MSSLNPRLLHRDELEPVQSVTSGLASDAKTSRSKGTIHYNIPVPAPGKTAHARVDSEALKRVLGIPPGAALPLKKIVAQGKIVHGNDASAMALATNVGITFSKRHPTVHTGTIRIQTKNDNRMFAGDSYSNGVAIRGHHMLLNGHSTTETTLEPSDGSNLSDKEKQIVASRYQAAELNKSPEDMKRAHAKHRVTTTDPRTGETHVGYAIPIINDGTTLGPSPVHPFLASRDPGDNVVANTAVSNGIKKVILKENDFDVVATALSKNTKLEQFDDGHQSDPTKREAIIQVSNPPNSGIPENSAVAALKIDYHTTESPEGDDEPRPEDKEQADLEAALLGGYKSVFSDKVSSSLGPIVPTAAPEGHNFAEPNEFAGGSEDED